ncbi:hypothetical protein LPJ64_005773, partial [Coemansia asiatica]
WKQQDLHQQQQEQQQQQNQECQCKEYVQQRLLNDEWQLQMPLKCNLGAVYYQQQQQQQNEHDALQDEFAHNQEQLGQQIADLPENVQQQRHKQQHSHQNQQEQQQRD